MQRYRVYIHGDYIETIDSAQLLAEMAMGTYDGMESTYYGFYSNQGVCRFVRV